jgi:hypothetical protein
MVLSCPAVQSFSTQSADISVHQSGSGNRSRPAPIVQRGQLISMADGMFNLY